MALAPPYLAIKNRFLSGRVVPFLGAGASFGARDPGTVPWRKPVNPAANEWDVTYLPTARELAECLAEEVAFPNDETQELTKVAQYYGAVLGRTPLNDRLTEIFTLQQQPAAIHLYLAEVTRHAPLLIVTTNYDDLLERAFDAAGRPYDMVVHLSDPRIGGEILWRKHGDMNLQPLLAKDLDIDIDKISVIYKIHGTIDRGTGKDAQYVITEDDYVDFLTRMTRNTAIPNVFAEPFQTRPFLFLGYSLYDWNLRVVLNRIDRELRRPGDIQSWAIEARPKPLESILWQRRNVQVFDNLTIDKFVSSL